jgi:hypothetical protein
VVEDMAPAQELADGEFAAECDPGGGSCEAVDIALVRTEPDA